MAKILGLDLGTNSIGWAVVDATFNEEGKVVSYNYIDDSGVRIFPEGVVAKTIGQGDKEQSNNATRRDKRQMRRQYYRKRLRKIKLLEVLIEQGMCPLEMSELKQWKNWDRSKKTEGKKFPDTEEFTNWLRLNPYGLRAKALNEAISLHELGRVFYHLIQRRGFLSSRKGNDESSIFTKGKPEENILPINKTKEEIGTSTLGAHLNKIRYKDNEPFARKTDEEGIEIRPRGRYTTRDMYIDEFKKIWKKQSEYLDINERIVEAQKVRELKGFLEGNRNRHKIDSLIEKYGEDNITIESIGQKGTTKVTSYTKVSLNEFLAGKIEHETNADGNDKLQFKSNESVLFWQRPLRSQKSLLSNCRFENALPVIMNNGEIRMKDNKPVTRSKKPCPISHPEFELFRAYQFINNIRYGKNEKLSDEHKEVVIKLQNNPKGKDKIKFGDIPKALNMVYEKFNYENEFDVVKNQTIRQLKPLFPEKIWDEDVENIWHYFYFYEDNDKLLQKLKDKYNFSGDINQVKKVRLKEGYSNVSLKAIRNIMPFLEKGFQYDRAVLLGGIKNAFGKRWDHFSEFHHEIERAVIRIMSEDNKDGEAISKIKEYLSDPINSFGFEQDDVYFTQLYHHSQEVEQKEELEDYLPKVENLRNPIVQQGINETRRLVNLLLKKYREELGSDFHFQQIKVEMGRDLRNNKTKRQEMGFRIRENEAKNDEARERLAEYGLSPTRNNVQKYLMFKEIEAKGGKAQCPYTGKVISIADLLGSDNAIQIEHIIPYSVSLDDGFGNKTLCEANFNREKGEKTPYDFYHNVNSDPKLWGAIDWDAIAARAFNILPYAKAKRFTSKKEFEKSSFIERQLNDSRYIAKKAVELLGHVCKDVRVMPGQLTAELRHLWGLNNILQPIQELDKQKFDVDHNESTPYYVVTDEDDNVLELHKVRNERPETSTNEILLTGYSKKNKIKSKYFQFDVETPDLNDGKYWMKFTVSDEVKLLHKFTEKPPTDEKTIVFRGKSDKGYFSNDTTGRIKSEVDDGIYWAKFNVLNKKFEEPEKDQQPKAKRNQILLYGNVVNRLFKCYIYQCDTELPDGKYWILLDVDIDNVEFTRAINPNPEMHDNQLLITATVDDSGLMVADPDAGYKIKTDNNAGKYYATLSITDKDPEIHLVENEPPKIAKNQKLVEGNIWIDKYTGEIKFDPKKNRDDHRHHAIDAITIACTEQGFLQRLSAYNADRKDKQRGKLDSTEKYPMPWNTFDTDAKKAANNILISFRKNNKTLVKNKKGFSVKGQLHKENVYGKRQTPMQEEAYHRRTKITELKDNKHVSKVVDSAIRKLIEEHLQNNCSINIRDPKGYSIPKDAFFKDGNWQLFLPNKNGEKVPIKKIRMKRNLNNAVQLKSNLNQHVNPDKNHHVLLYETEEGNLKEDVVQFWTVVERKKQHQPTYQLPEDGVRIVNTMEINDMFLLGLSNDEFESNKNNPTFLSRYLYRVQKVSNSNYMFRFHLASTLLNKSEEIHVQSMGSLLKQNPIKVRITPLGKIEKI